MPYPEGMPWRKRSNFRLIALKDAVRLTGLKPAELLLVTGTQQLTRVDENGAREECARVPIELLLEQPPEED